MTAPVKPTRTFVWSVIWRNPYQPRPEGFPEVMLRVEQERPAGAGAGPCPTEIDECWQEMHYYGYCVSVYMTYIPARTLPIATKHRIRRRNLWKRLLKKYPMFASDWYAEAVQARPDHYGAYTPGEFADVQFARGLMGSLKIAKPSRETIRGIAKKRSTLQ